MPKILFRRRDLFGSNPDKSRAIRKLMENDDVADVLDKPAKRRQFRDALRKYTKNDRYVTEEEVRSALADLKFNTSDKITRKEVRALRKSLDVGGVIKNSDLSIDNPLRRNKGGYQSSQVSTQRPPRWGLPF
jgi:hypothetical protein